jgi:hypothetical protein
MLTLTLISTESPTSQGSKPQGNSACQSLTLDLGVLSSNPSPTKTKRKQNDLTLAS